MNRNNLIFLDTETTGTGREDRLCQIAYAFDGSEHESLFKPPIPITIDAMVVTHITNKTVINCEPFASSQMHTDLHDIFSVGNIVVAHNAPFDISMLTREGLVIERFIDTFKLAHHLDPEETVPRKSLQYLRYYYDLDVDDALAHSALGDVRVLQKLFDFFFQKMSGTIEDEEKILETMIEISSRPILFNTFTFGKYTGRKVSEIAVEDAPYISWMLNQKIMTRENGGENDENWIYTLDYYLTRS
ncbi:MAG: 3'-5' exonuclease [Candidatus Moranbacteria bacterium]|nr:3'-5' exonuclease [Candidatus Moranbacteria bacterium]MDD3965007.1 3'-5' exonuclease [Candidatus Moranbacteria bacterium]